MRLRTCFVGHVWELCDDDCVLGSVDALDGVGDYLHMALSSDSDSAVT